MNDWNHYVCTSLDWFTKPNRWITPRGLAWLKSIKNAKRSNAKPRNSRNPSHRSARTLEKVSCVAVSMIWNEKKKKNVEKKTLKKRNLLFGNECEKRRERANSASAYAHIWEKIIHYGWRCVECDALWEERHLGQEVKTISPQKIIFPQNTIFPQKQPLLKNCILFSLTNAKRGGRKNRGYASSYALCVDVGENKAGGNRGRLRRRASC